jgi:hypothetical protein
VRAHPGFLLIAPGRCSIRNLLSIQQIEHIADATLNNVKGFAAHFRVDSVALLNPPAPFETA